MTLIGTTTTKLGKRNY